ncbi:sugar ABC transporter ATP-binding protein [Alsobacter sp. KACC 23698]|uniref:Sugar ABC transporter ATP-binding protein n=1 Tax=Alsobacter sp. KACC 23698 TaxID=3149229 RepID=A0AAU7JLW9_9HYPH
MGASPVPTQAAPVLEMRGISKTFPGVRALHDVSLKVHAGEIHALMGENGAGKSTLMKILSGAYQADPGGTILIDGRPVTIAGPLDGRRLGVSIIYQELALAPNLSVAENMLLGREPARAGFVDRAAMAAECRPVLERLGVAFGPSALVSGLSMAERQQVEIARAAHAQARILVMDEPTTSLSSRETEALFALVRQLRAEGMAIIYISHRMNEVYELADRVSVLRDGGHVGALTRAELSADALVRMMVGRDLSSFYKKEHDAHASRGPVLLSVRGLADGRRVRGCSFDLHQGEVLGIAGLVGAGRTELARLIYGAERPVAGTVELEGRPFAPQGPGEAIEAGLVYLTEDRKHLGLFLDMTVRENINLGVIGRDSRWSGFLDRAKARMRSSAAVKALGVRTPTDLLPVGALSGGNQQKVLLARLLETKPKVLILDEPTRGVDIGAKSEIYRLIDDLARSGVGVVVISSELPEIVGVCDRVLVMREGAMAGEVGGATGRAITQENIGAIATGAAAELAA